MQPLLTTDIEQISISDRIQLVEDLWDSIPVNPEPAAVTRSQQQALEERLKNHRIASNDSSSWQVTKARMGSL
ncbi:MAG: addiction module protein [Cyanobacteria bacterium P01_D01_bin.1]